MFCIIKFIPYAVTKKERNTTNLIVGKLKSVHKPVHQYNKW